MSSSKAITLNQVTAKLNPNYQLSQINWQVNLGQHWVLLGPNGSGKSALTRVLLDLAEITSGERTSQINRTQLISFEQQKQLLEDELKKDDADILDVIPQGTLVKEILFPDGDASTLIDHALAEKLINTLQFSAMLNRKFRDLSTGETRKLLLIKAFINQPKLMVLDEPFDGLDAQSSQHLQTILQELSHTISMIFVLNRADEIPDFISHYAYLVDGKIQFSFEKTNSEALAELNKLIHLQQSDIEIPPSDSKPSYQCAAEAALVELKQAKVAYADNTIFEKLDWRITPNQHWQLTGKNGSGKTCLLNLITGDNPQCYRNDIWVFGYKRGSGESIWQIKQHIGFISNALHMDYRVSTSALNTIISGFYDSIGLYHKPTLAQQNIAKQWLALLGLLDKQTTPFNLLSFGDQRMLLIARAMVKLPPLLILDEPCLGLDELNRQRVLVLIEKICASKKTTVIYVNHHAKDKIEGIQNFLAMEDYQAS